MRRIAKLEGNYWTLFIAALILPGGVLLLAWALYKKPKSRHQHPHDTITQPQRTLEQQ